MDFLNSDVASDYVTDDIVPALKRVLGGPDAFRLKAAQSFQRDFPETCFFPNGTLVDPRTYTDLNAFAKAIKICGFCDAGLEGHYFISFSDPTRFGNDSFRVEFNGNDEAVAADLDY